MDFVSRITDLCDIARAAGERIMTIYGRSVAVEQKPDRSPLTEADRAAHELICARLCRLAPDIPVVSEESADPAGAAREAGSRFWLVDPLDGTKEFLSRNGEFTVNIALVMDGRAVLGVVYAPAAELLYYAAAGKRAFKRKADAAARPISARSFASGRPVVVASRSHAGPDTAAFLKSLGEHKAVSMGSSLKLCLVAEGAADAYPRLGPTMEWDTAAAQCVLEAAGGSVTGPDHRPLTYGKPGLRNPWFIACGRGGHDWHRYLLPTV